MVREKSLSRDFDNFQFCCRSRWILLLMFIYSFIGTIRSQSVLGFDGGTNVAHFVGIGGPFPSNSQEYMAYQLGVSFKSLKHKWVNLGEEINYRKKSNDLDIYVGGPGGGQEASGHFKIGYLSILVLPEIEFVTDNKIKGYLNAGGYWGMCLYDRFTGNISGSGTSVASQVSYTNSEKGSNFISGFDKGLLFGAGINIPLSTKLSLKVGCRIFMEANNGFSGSMLVSSRDVGIICGLHLLLDKFNIITEKK
jgi:hypothetical protein